MGYMRHHAIIVTSCLDEHLEAAHVMAVSIFKNVSPVINSEMNGERSFLVPPDGSKEGWEESNKGDENRQDFKDFLELPRTHTSWVEVQYGDGERETKIIDFGPR